MGRQAYARGRPGYPQAIAGWLRDKLVLGPGRAVPDIGADVMAVEPVDAMRACLQTELPPVRAIAATAQPVPLPDRSLDALVCAQAFHWFAQRETLDEFHRLIEPGGKLGLVWNVRDEAVDWVAQSTGPR